MRYKLIDKSFRGDELLRGQFAFNFVSHEFIFKYIGRSNLDLYRGRSLSSWTNGLYLNAPVLNLMGK